MQTNATNLQNYLSTWDNFREIWEINKTHFIRRYQNLNPQVSSFDADIARYEKILSSFDADITRYEKILSSFDADIARYEKILSSFDADIAW